MSLATTLVVAVIRAGGAAITGSGALLSGALQAAGDGISQSVLMAAARGGRGAKGLHFSRHPLAQERQRNFWPLALGALLAGVGAGLVTAVAVGRLGHAPHLPPAYGPIAASIAVATTLWKAVPAVSASWWHDLARLRHARRPDVALVTLQDALSLGCGGVVTAAVAATALTGNPMFDTVGMLAAGVIMATSAALHLLLMRRTVVGRGASRAEQQGIAAAIEVEPSVVRLAHLDTYHASPDELLVAARVDLITGLDLAEVRETVQRLKASVRRAVPTICALYLEPDTSESPTIDAGTALAQVPEIRPSGSDFESGSVIIAREATNHRTQQEGQPWQSA